MDLKGLPALLAKYKADRKKRFGRSDDYRIVICPDAMFDLFFKLAFVDPTDGRTIPFRSFSTLEELVEAMEVETKSIWDCIPGEKS